MNHRAHRRALTALEIGIVLVVVAILVAVGVRWYLGHYLVKQRIAKSRGDLEGLAKAIEARYTDNSWYPIPLEYLRSPEFLARMRDPERMRSSGRNLTFWYDYETLVMEIEHGPPYPSDLTFASDLQALWPRSLTTPYPYIKEIPADPFRGDGDRGYRYMVHRSWWFPVSWVLVGHGPDGDLDLPVSDFGRDTGRKEKSPNDPRLHLGFPRPLITYYYDPTNGLCSDGDLIRIKQ